MGNTLEHSPALEKSAHSFLEQPKSFDALNFMKEGSNLIFTQSAFAKELSNSTKTLDFNATPLKGFDPPPLASRHAREVV